MKIIESWHSNYFYAIIFKGKELGLIGDRGHGFTEKHLNFR